MAKRTIQNKWAQNSSNVQQFSEVEIASGIEYKGAVVSNQLNGVAADLYDYADNLQRAGTAWNPLKSYEVGDVVEVRAVLNSEQLSAKFACVAGGKDAPLVDSGATSFILDSDKNVCVFTITDDGTKTLKAYCGTSWVLLKSNGFYTRDIIDVIYPVGSIYVSLNVDFDPNVAWKGSTWEKLDDGIFLEATSGEYEEFDTGYFEVAEDRISMTTTPIIGKRGKHVGTKNSPGVPNIFTTAQIKSPDPSYRAAWFDGLPYGPFKGKLHSAPPIKISGTYYVRVWCPSFDAASTNQVWGTDKIYREDVGTVQPFSISVFMWQRIA